MKQRILLIILTSFCMFSCTTDKPKTKREQIQHVIKTCGFIKLPLSFCPDLDYVLQSKYHVNLASDDTLLFDNVYNIVGFFPDTTNYYAFLHRPIENWSHPAIVTMDKNGQKIDEKIIRTTKSCEEHIQFSTTSISDIILIYKDLTFESISKAKGVVGIDDINDYPFSQMLDTCSMIILEGFIDKNGKINSKERNIINCNE